MRSRYKRKMRRIGILGLLILCASLINLENVFSENGTYRIGITSVVERIHLEQSQQVEKKFLVKNDSDSELKFKNGLRHNAFRRRNIKYFAKLPQ